MHQSLRSRYFWWKNKTCHHWWCTSYQPWRAVLHFLKPKLSFLHFFIFHCQQTQHHNIIILINGFFLLFQTFYHCCCISYHNNPYSCALFCHSGSIPCWIFCFHSHFFLLSYIFLLFCFYFKDISYLQVCGFPYQISGTVAYIAYYRLLSLFFIDVFIFFIFSLLVSVIQFFTNHINCLHIVHNHHEVVFEPIKNHIIFQANYLRHGS